MRGVARQEHPADSIVPGLPPLAEKPRTPPHLGHAEVLAGDAAERVADLVQRHRLGQRRLLAQPVPGDRTEPAVAERDQQHHTLRARLGRTRSRPAARQAGRRPAGCGSRIACRRSRCRAAAAPRCARRRSPPRSRRARCRHPRDSTVTPSSSCVSPTTSAPRMISTPSSSARASSTCSVPLCGTISTIANRLGSSRRSSVAPPGGATSYTGTAARSSSSASPRASSNSRVRACTANALVMLGVSVRSLQQPHLDAAEGEFARQHQSGRSRADHDNIRVATRPDGSRIRLT